ncbi:MAG: glycosyltransferase family 4 protein [Pseudomonadota bacterium]
MRILFLSFYYQPDLCAGSFRNTSLVHALQQQLPKESCIDVLTTLPNRYSTFSADALSYEKQDAVQIYRIALPSHNSGMIDQSKAFMVYARNVLKLVANQQYDIVYASSSRLMTATLGAYIARKKKIPLYLDIRDIFADTLRDVLPKKISWFFEFLFSQVEAWTVKHAATVNVVSEGFIPYFKERYPKLQLSRFTNGIDDEFLHLQPNVSEPIDRKIIQVLYAGNIGEGQGLHHIIPTLAKRLEGRVSFKIIGSGGRLEQLKSAVTAAGCQNVELCAPLMRAALIEAYQNADVLFLHLNNYDAFKKVLPSKLFEYAAMGKPIWAGVGGFAAEFTNKNIPNSGVFSPCDQEQAMQAFASLTLITEPRHLFISNYARVNIMRNMAANLMQVVRKN